jgi:hypothetical protein
MARTFYQVDSIVDVAERILTETDGTRMPYALVSWRNRGTTTYENTWQPFTDLNPQALADARALMQRRRDAGPPVRVFLNLEDLIHHRLSDDPDIQEQ